jgi:hypothetical protein
VFVVGDDPTQQCRCVPVASAVHDVCSFCRNASVFLLGGALIKIGSIGAAASGHGDVGQCARGVLAQERVGGVGGDALGGVHGDGVAVGDVFADIVVGEGAQCLVVEAAGDDAVVVLVDPGDAPALSVAYRALFGGGVAGVAQCDGGVVVSGEDEVAD